MKVEEVGKLSPCVVRHLAADARLSPRPASRKFGYQEEALGSSAVRE